MITFPMMSMVSLVAASSSRKTSFLIAYPSSISANSRAQSTITGTCVIKCAAENPGLKIALHFFHKGPSMVTRFSGPPSGVRNFDSNGCLGKGRMAETS